MLSRKHIVAPKSFNPGPGLPREHLAFLSKAEMEMLRQMTDGKIDPGPKGIPSFAVTSGTTSGTSMGGTSPSGGTGQRGAGSNYGPGSGQPGTTSSSGTASKTASGASSSSTGQGGQGSGGSHPASGGAPGSTSASSSAGAAKSSSASAPSSSVSGATAAKAPSTASAGPASPMGGQGSSFSAPSAAKSYNAGVTAAARAPAGPASPMGGQGSSFSSPSAAASANRATASAIKGGQNASGSSPVASAMAGANTRNYPGQGVTAPAPNGGMMAPNAGTDFSRTLRSLGSDLGKPNPNFDNSPVTFGNWATDSFGRIAGLPGTPEQQRKAASEAIRTVAGEAGLEGLLGQSAVAKVMENRLALGQAYPGQYGYLGGGQMLGENGVLGGFDANGYQHARTGPANETYNEAQPGTASYSRAAAGVADSLDPYGNLATERPDVLNATHYGTQAAVDAAKWGTGNPQWDRTAVTLGNHVFGNPENTVDRVKALNDARLPGAARTAAATAPAGGVQLASYQGGPAQAQINDPNWAPGSPAPAAPEAPAPNWGSRIMGAISGLKAGQYTDDALVRALSDPTFKRYAGMVTSSNPLVSGMTKAAFGQVAGPAVKAAVARGIQGLKDTFDPNNPRARGGAEGGGEVASASAPSRSSSTTHGPSDSLSAPARTEGSRQPSRDRNPDSGKGGDRGVSRPQAPAASVQQRPRRRSPASSVPPAPAVNPWDYYTTVTPREEALRNLLGKEWFA